MSHFRAGKSTRTGCCHQHWLGSLEQQLQSLYREHNWAVQLPCFSGGDQMLFVYTHILLC